jgi:hypothetical protein
VMLQKKKGCLSTAFLSRDDWIRTSDHTPPRRVRYRAALRPEQVAKVVNFLYIQNDEPVNFA